MNEIVDSLLDMSGAREDWQPFPRLAIAAWITFYLVYLLYAATHGHFAFIGPVNLVTHEAGHLLFRWFGQTLCLWGGTILQLAVPFLLAVYFFHQRSVAGFIFCMFFFFENWTEIATYMADARAMILPLVTVGDSDFVEHDWHAIFSSLGLLQYDTAIAAVVRTLGWCGMLASVGWLASRWKEERSGA